MKNESNSHEDSIKLWDTGNDWGRSLNMYKKSLMRKIFFIQKTHKNEKKKKCV